MPCKFRRRRQAGSVRLLGDQDGRTLIAALLVQPATDDLQRALLGEVEEAASERRDTDVDVAGYRRGCDGLRRLRNGAMPG